MHALTIQPSDAAVLWPHREVWMRLGLPALLGEAMVTVYRDRDADTDQYEYRLMIERPSGTREESIHWGDLLWLPEDDAVIALVLEDDDAVAMRVYHARVVATHLH